MKKLVFAGYTRYDQVDGTSQFAVRGGIIDIFPTYLNEPVRIEFWGDTVDTISSFDIDTQRRSGKVDFIEITPANEVLVDDNFKFADKIEALSKGLKGKAIKAREKLNNDIDKLRQGFISIALISICRLFIIQTVCLIMILTGFLLLKAQELRKND